MSCTFTATRIQGTRDLVLRRTGPPYTPGVEEGFGPTQGRSTIQLVGSDGSTATMAPAASWAPDVLLATLPPGTLPAPSYTVRITIDTTSALGVPIRSGPCDAMVDLSDPLADPLRFTVAIPQPAVTGAPLTLVNTLPTFRFDAAMHGPVRVECGDGVGRADLESVTGWGSQVLTGTVPESFACDLTAHPVAMIRFGTNATGVPVRLIRAPAAPGTRPLSGRYRLVLNGFRVDRETSDHVLEVDGKGDEVFFQVQVAEADLAAGTVAPWTRTSLTFGDVNNFPARVQAGSRSSLGGLRTGDAAGTHSRGSAPLFDRLPMTLWDGTLSAGLNGVVVVPTVWESDMAVDTSLREPDWGVALGGMAAGSVTAVASAVRTRLGILDHVPLPAGAAVDASELVMTAFGPLRITRDGVGIFGRAGDHPVGMTRAASVPGVGDTDEVFPQMVVLTYETAFLASRTVLVPGEMNGVFTLTYAGENRNWNEGTYTLFLQIEEVA